MSKKGGSTPAPVPPPAAPTTADATAVTDAENTNTDQQSNARGLGQTLLTSGQGAELDSTNTNKKSLLGGAGY